MSALIFFAGVFLGVSLTFVRPWLVDLWDTDSAQQLLSRMPWTQAIDAHPRIDVFAPVSAPRFLSGGMNLRSKMDVGMDYVVNSSTLKQRVANKYESMAVGESSIRGGGGVQADGSIGHDGSTQGSTARNDRREEHGDSDNSSADVANIQMERGISLMTLGAVAFQMGLFYLVNHADEDMRRYSYQIIGDTISIFCAVLMFNACYAWVEELAKTLNEVYHITILIAMCLFFYVAMEVTVMLFARVRGTKALRHSFNHGKELSMLLHVMNAKTFGAGAAQMCGAAAIRCFGHLQLWCYSQAESTTLHASVVPLAFVFFAVMMCIMHCARHKIIYWDGIVDEAEYVWVQTAEQCEHEVCAICIGFILASVARMAVTDSFPHIVLSEYQHSLEEADVNGIRELLLIGVLCACVCFGTVIQFYGLVDNDIDHEKVRTETKSRLLTLFVRCTGMTFAWCVCFGIHLMAMHVGLLGGAQLHLMLSLVQSFASIMLIRFLDIFADMECTGLAFNKAIVTLIECLAVSMGFSWEYAFHECVKVTVSYMAEDPRFPSEDPKLWSFCLCSALCVMVLPAYRLYIVPTRYELIEEFEHRRHDQEMEFRRASIYGVDLRKERPQSCQRSQVEEGREEYTFQFGSNSRECADSE